MKCARKATRNETFACSVIKRHHLIALIACPPRYARSTNVNKSRGAW